MIFDARTPWYKRIKLLRTERDLSQEGLASMIGVPIRTYQRWETGENVPIAIYKAQIAKTLNVEEATIFTGKVERRPEYTVKKK